MAIVVWYLMMRMRNATKTGATAFMKTNSAAPAPPSSAKPAATTTGRPPPVTNQDLLIALHELKARQDRTDKLLEQHILEEREERQVRTKRYEGLMSLLGDIIGKLPTPTSTST